MKRYLKPGDEVEITCRGTYVPGPGLVPVQNPTIIAGSKIQVWDGLYLRQVHFDVSPEEVRLYWETEEKPVS